MASLVEVQAELGIGWDRVLAAAGERAIELETRLLRLLRELEADRQDDDPGVAVQRLLREYGIDDGLGPRFDARGHDRLTPIDRYADLVLDAPDLGWQLARDDRPISLGLQYARPPGGPRPTARRGFVVPVLYATDRQLRHRNTPSTMYGNRPAELSFGTAEVIIPQDHVRGRLEGPWPFRLRFFEDPERHVTVHSAAEQSEREWISALRSRLRSDYGGQATEANRDILLFVHGFNVSWGSALRRTAQLATDLDFRGIPVLFSWPSMGNLLYTWDEAANERTAALQHFTSVVRTLLRTSGARRVHIIAHSMGNRLLTQTLRELRRPRRSAAVPPAALGEVVFAAPDVDRDVFAAAVERFFGGPGARINGAGAPPPQLTLYACGVDSALGLSRGAHRMPRAGSTRHGVLVHEPMETVDATRAITRGGHSYFCDNHVVLADLFAMLAHGHRADQRFGLEPELSDGRRYWAMTATRR